MQITGKIIEKLPLREGVGARGPWAISTLVVEFADGQYTTQLALQNMNKAEEFEALPLGAFGQFDFSVASRKSQSGAWFTSCTCYKWNVNGGSAATAANDDMPI